MQIRHGIKRAFTCRTTSWSLAIALPTCVFAFAGACSVSVTPIGDPEICLGSEPVSCFYNGDDGWRVLGGDFGGLTRPVWEFGAVSAQGEGDWYWIAPSKYLGDMSAAFGKRLSFEIEVPRPFCDYAPNFGGWVRLSGAGMTLRWGEDDSSFWDGFGRTTLSVVFDETESWFNEATGDRASDADMLGVLSQLDRLEIIGMYPHCPGTSMLHRVHID